LPKGEPITAAEAKNARASDLHTEAIDTLYDEAKQWFDADFNIETEAQAEGVEKMLDLAREAWNAADDDRDKEKRPHDLAGKEVQKRYRPILQKAERIQDSCKAKLKLWRDKLKERKEREAEATRKAAAEAAERAAQAAKAARGDLGAMELAESAQEEADRLTRAANKAEKNVNKGLGLRTVGYDIEITDRKEALKHYLVRNPQAFVDLIEELARADARQGALMVPGITITPRKEAF
jgi:hypothetical protein